MIQQPVFNRRQWGVAAAGALASCSAPKDSSSGALSADGPLYFDMHIDTPARLVSEGLNPGESHPYTCVDIPKMKQSGLNAGYFAIFAPARSMTPTDSLKQGLRTLDVVVEEVKRHPSELFLAATANDVLRVKRKAESLSSSVPKAFT